LLASAVVSAVAVAVAVVAVAVAAIIVAAVAVAATVMAVIGEIERTQELTGAAARPRPSSASRTR
jgi:hypothetical protein